MTYASAETEAAKSCFGPYKAWKVETQGEWMSEHFRWMVDGSDDVAGVIFLLFSRYFFLVCWLFRLN